MNRTPLLTVLAAGVAASVIAAAHADVVPVHTVHTVSITPGSTGSGGLSDSGFDARFNATGSPASTPVLTDQQFDTRFGGTTGTPVTGNSADYDAGYAAGSHGVVYNPDGSVHDWGNVDPIEYQSNPHSDYSRGVQAGLDKLKSASRTKDDTVTDPTKTAATDCKDAAKDVPGYASMSPSCQAIAQEAACAKNDAKKLDELGKKFETAQCNPPQVDTPAPVAAGLGANVPTNPVDALKQAAAGALGLNGADLGSSLLGGMGGNWQQMMQSMLQQQLLSQLMSNGGNNPNTANGGGQDGYFDPTQPSTDGCDSIVSTQTTSSTAVIDGVSRTTIVATATCANGLTQTVTQINDTLADGSVSTTTITEN